MTEPNSPRPVPGPPRPGPGPTHAPATTSDTPTPPADRAGERPFDDLDERPVADHVPVFEAEHSRLQRELGTIDEL
jgi:hypothetical protein